MEPRKTGLTRRALLLGAPAALGMLAGRQCLLPTSDPGPRFPGATQPYGSGGVLNDASELCPTPVASHVVIQDDPRAGALERIRTALAEARAARRPFIASAARHSMGGQSLARDGTVATLDQRWLEADTARKTYRVAAGARWSNVIASLDPLGFSPTVMQSNNDFGVASTFSVNAHGWPVSFSGGTTVKAMTMVLADGSVVTCSRTENAALFRHAMGGYGLFGVITELELDMQPNAMLAPRFEEMSGPELGTRFAQQLASDPTIQMAYGRMDVSLDRFFEQALLITYRPTGDQSKLPAATGSGLISRTSRYVFRGQVESDRTKHFRWWAESGLGPRIVGKATRNTLLNEPVVTLDDRDPFRTDILHEYFVAPARFAEFVKACQTPTDQFVRGWERRFGIGLEFQGKAIYAKLIERAVAATAPAQLSIRSIVSGIDKAALARIPNVTVVGDRGGAIEIETPRYDLFTRILAEIARQGGAIVEIAGNDEPCPPSSGPSSSA